MCHACLEAVGDAETYVIVVLPASPAINIQAGSSGVEITRFEPYAPPMPRPHIQSGSELDYAGIGAGGPGVRSAQTRVGASRKRP